MKPSRPFRHTGESRYLASFRGFQQGEIPVFTGMTLLHFGFTTVSFAGMTLPTLGNQTDPLPLRRAGSLLPTAEGSWAESFPLRLVKVHVYESEAPRHHSCVFIPIEIAMNSETFSDNAQTRKLYDLGSRLTRVAHEINVPLSLIVGSLDALAQYTDTLADYVLTEKEQSSTEPLARRAVDIDYVAAHTPKLIAICREGTQRLQHIVGQLRSYSHRKDAAVQGIELTDVIAAASRLASQGATHTPELHLPALPAVRGDANSLEQVFVNLICNAMDAVADCPDPRVSVIACVEADIITVMVRDNGPGVAPEIASRIFEPFFTTKPRRVGLGLGLAIVHEIIADHGGTICLGKPERGAEFIVRLPAESL